jgi:hypothetical protein
MNTLERAGAVIGVVVFAFSIGVGWNALNNRIDKVDEKIGAIQKTLGSTTCNAILTRQIEAIEKNRPEPRKALEALSAQYDCVPHKAVGDLPANWSDAINASEPMAAGEYVGNLEAQLNAIDVQLNNAN